MKNMKKFAAVCMAAAMGMSLFTGCGSSSSAAGSTANTASEASATESTADAASATSTADATADAKDAKIGLIAMVENGAFMDMKNGIIDTLEEAGYGNVEYKCAGGDSSALQSML